MASGKLYRLRDGKVFGGVAAGIAEHSDISVVTVRVVMVILAFAGIGIPFYLIAWMLLPKEPAFSEEPRTIGVFCIMLRALGIAVCLALLGDHFDDMGDYGWVPFAVGLAVGLFFFLRSRMAGGADDSEGESGRFALYRSSLDSKIAGVFGGLGEMLGVDPTLLRIGGAVLAIVTFPSFVLLYLIYAMIVPKQNLHILIE